MQVTFHTVQIHTDSQSVVEWLKHWTLQFHPNLGSDDFWRFLNPDMVVYILQQNQIMGHACISKCDRVFEDRKNAWYIDMICVSSESCHLGSHLMREIERQAVHEKVDTIALSALPQTLLFYYKLGYRFIRSQKETEDSNLSDSSLKLIDIFRTSNLDAFQFMVEIPIARRLLVSLVKRGQTYRQLMNAKYGLDEQKSSDLIEIRGGVYMMKVIR